MEFFIISLVALLGVLSGFGMVYLMSYFDLRRSRMAFEKSLTKGETTIEE